MSAIDYDLIGNDDYKDSSSHPPTHFAEEARALEQLKQLLDSQPKSDYAPQSQQQRPQSAVVSGSRPQQRKSRAPALDIDEVFPPNEHNARKRAELKLKQSTLNQAHAFGPGRVILDEDNRPRTAEPRRRAPHIAAQANPSSGGENENSDSDSNTRRSHHSHRLTETEPFNLGSPNGAGTTSRTKQRLLEYLGEVKAREEEHLQKTFKANPLPVSTLEPRFEQMMREAKLRSRQIRKERKKLTAAMVKPFEFAASKALAERKRQQRRMEMGSGGAAESDNDQTVSGSESASNTDSNQHRRRKSQRSDAGSESDVAGSGTIGDGDHADSDSETIQSEASYQVAFGFTTRTSPANQKVKERIAAQSPPQPYSNPYAQPFKANKIPWSSSHNLLDSIMKQRDEARERRVRKRAEELVRASALPPRMEMHKKKLEKVERREIELDEEAERRRRKKMPPEPTYKPYVNTTVPDFDRLQAEFAAELDAKKKSVPLTKVEEFDITESKKKPIQHPEPKLFKARPYIPPPPPEEAPATTEKMKAIIARNTARIKALEEKKLKEQREIEERLKQNPEMQQKLIPKIHQSHSHGASTTEETIRELTRQAKKDLKAKDAAWQARVAEMKDRVRTRPLLVESYNSTQGRIEARKKALLAIKESLDKAGIKDQSKFFDQQELADLDLKF